MVRGLIYSFLFIIVAGASASQENADGRRTYKVMLPDCIWEYERPSKLVQGYGKPTDRVDFLKTGKRFDKFTWAQEEVATYYYGVRGDFRDWDMTFDFLVVQYHSLEPMGSENLKQSIAEHYVKSYELKDGQKFSPAVKVDIQKIGSHELVVATSADLFKSVNETLRGGGKLTRKPFRTYYYQATPTLIIGVRVFNFTESKRSKPWYVDADELASEIFDHMRLISHESASQ